jgi:hypothetical protein
MSIFSERFPRSSLVAAFRGIPALLMLVALPSLAAPTLELSRQTGPGYVAVTLTTSGFDPGPSGALTSFTLDGAFVRNCPTTFDPNCAVTVAASVGAPGEHEFRATSSLGQVATAKFFVS